MPRFIITAFACLALALGGALIAGCGDDEETASTPAATETAEPATETGGGTSGDVTVSMKNSKNVPEEIAVEVDQKIVWTNDDSYDHNVTATEGADFASDNFGGGGTYEYTPTKAGIIDYVCTIHSGQIGKITVTE